MEFISNIEMEQHVLGCMFLNDAAVKKAVGCLTMDSFADARHKAIFAAMKELEQKHIKLDQLTLKDELKHQGKLQAIGDFAYIMQLSQHMPTTAQLESYIETLLEYERRRTTQRICQETAWKSKDLSLSQDKVIAEARKSLDEVNCRNNIKAEDGDGLAMSFLQGLYDNRLHPELQPKIFTGFTNLDELLHGLKPGTLNLLAARPAMGKTSLALNIAINAAKNEGKETKRVLFVSLEMSDKQLMERCASSMSGINCSKIQEPSLMSEGEYIAATYGVYAFRDLDVRIYQASSFTVNKLRQLLYSYRVDEKPELVIIDYLQLMVTEQHDDSYTRVTKVSNGLKSLALEFSLPVLALCQLNRAVESRVAKKPFMSDLRESGSLEQDADVVMLMYSKDYNSNKAKKEPGVVNIEIAKARSGATGTVKLFFDKSCSRFMELGG